MPRRNRVLCCCMLLFVVSSSDSWEKSDDEHNENLMVRHDLHEKDQTDKNELMQLNSRENFIKSREKVQHEFRIDSTKDYHENDDSTRYEFHARAMMNDEANDRTKADYTKISSTIAKDDNNIASQETYGNFTAIENEDNYTMADDNSTLSNETCESGKCLQFCCRRGDRLIDDECVSGTGDYTFPKIEGLNDSANPDEILQLYVDDPCYEIKKHLAIDPNEYVIYINGSVYLRRYDLLIPWTRYCLAVNEDAYVVNVCRTPYPIFISIGLVVSLPFLLATFVVYSILPELQNMHGYTLRAHVASLFVTYAILPIYHQVKLFELGFSICLLMAYILTFSFTASFTWLNVICFDIWWAFRGFRSTQGNAKRQERKKFLLYSLYGWGGPLFLNIICAILDYVPDVPDYLVRPRYCKGTSWFGTISARGLYFYLPVTVTVICNICLFVITAFKIICHKKRTANDLRNTESKRHDDHKQRFTMYLKLLVVMGLTWIMEIAAWLDTQNTPAVVWYPTDMLNSLQGVIIFIIFVCRKKIKRLLMKRLDWHCGKISTSNESQSSVTTVSGGMNLQDINPPIDTHTQVH